MMVTLSENNTSGCTIVSITEDMLVEGQEYFQVSISVHGSYGSCTLEGSNLTKITILDSNSKKHIKYCINTTCIASNIMYVYTPKLYFLHNI